MKYLCPVCTKELRARAMNYPANIKKRSLESVYDRYVCSSCERTFSSEEIIVKREGKSPDWMF